MPALQEPEGETVETDMGVGVGLPLHPVPVANDGLLPIKTVKTIIIANRMLRAKMSVLFM
jgi:hypothetical protein